MGAPLSTWEIVSRIERKYGPFTLESRQVIPPVKKISKQLERSMRRNALQIAAFIREREYCRAVRRESTELTAACTCRKHDFPHVHQRNDAGPDFYEEPGPLSASTVPQKDSLKAKRAAAGSGSSTNPQGE